MKHILLYADSLSWGIIPGSRKRLVFEKRWPGVLENTWNSELESGVDNDRIRVIEDCLNGRRTAFDDPYKPGRNGLAGLALAMEIHSPLALVILFLGTNDFQSMHPHNAWHAARGCSALIQAIRRAQIEPGMPVPDILLMAPPPVENPRGPIAPKFLGADSKMVGLGQAYAELSRQENCHFFDCATVTTTSHVDGIHLDEDQHLKLGKTLAPVIKKLL